MFTGTSYDKKTGQAIEGPYRDDWNTLLKRACIRAGVPLAAIQSVLRHGNLQSTFRYLAKLRDGEVEAMEAFEEINRGSVPSVAMSQ